jgi:hypothetical protein
MDEIQANFGQTFNKVWRYIMKVFLKVRLLILTIFHIISSRSRLKSFDTPQILQLPRSALRGQSRD